MYRACFEMHKFLHKLYVVIKRPKTIALTRNIITSKENLVISKLFWVKRQVDFVIKIHDISGNCTS